MTRLADDRDFATAIGVAATELRIPAPIVEKDYWVTRVLAAMAGSYPDDWIFKGGTSLSKAYGLIERFSEDIDVLVMPAGRGKGACDTLMKAMAREAMQAVGGEGMPTGVTGERGVHRTYEIDYRPTAERATYLKQSVLLEMGVRGGAMPREVKEIRALITETSVAAAGDFEDLAPFTLQVLHPGRTLVEKLLLIHGVATAAAERPADPVSPAFGRHLYDVYQLLGSDEVICFLDERDEFLHVCEDASAISAEHFGSSVSRPEGGFSTSAAFIAEPGSEVAATMESALKQAQELAFPEASWPTPSDLRDRVFSQGDRL